MTLCSCVKWGGAGGMLGTGSSFCYLSYSAARAGAAVFFLLPRGDGIVSSPLKGCQGEKRAHEKASPSPDPLLQCPSPLQSGLPSPPRTYLTHSHTYTQSRILIHSLTHTELTHLLSQSFMLAPWIHLSPFLFCGITSVGFWAGSQQSVFSVLFAVNL